MKNSVDTAFALTVERADAEFVLAAAEAIAVRDAAMAKYDADVMRLVRERDAQIFQAIMLDRARMAAEYAPWAGWDKNGMKPVNNFVCPNCGGNDIVYGVSKPPS
jgi:hypothetical protein